MTDRSRIRVGREVTYRPTDAEAATGNDDNGALWKGTIAKVLAGGAVNLHVIEGDGGTIAVAAVVESQQKGGFTLIGMGPTAP
jgi:hypothetical protein